MSQSSVEKVIGLLATDEAFRRRFTEDPAGTLRRLAGEGMSLNACERHALMCLDPLQLARFAEAIDPRLQKADLRRAVRPGGVQQPEQEDIPS